MSAPTLQTYTVKEALNFVLNVDEKALDVRLKGATLTFDGDMQVDVSAFVNSEGEQTDAIVYTDGQSIATGYSAELIATQVDRDFSGASSWTNVDINAYNETTDLTITANAVGQYCTLPIANAPTEEGVVYRLSMDVANIVGSWKIQDFRGTQTLGIIDRNGTGQFVEFVAKYQENLITDLDNSDFDDGTINDWAVYTDDAGTCAYNVGPHNEKCAKVTMGANDTYTYGQLTTAYIGTLVNGRTYIATAKVYIPSANNNWTEVKIDILNLASAVIINQDVADLTIQDQWQEVSVEFTAAADVTGGIIVGGVGTTVNDVIYFDDVKIVDKDAASYTGGIRIVAVDANSSADFDNFSLKSIYRHFQGMGGYDATGNTFRALPINIDDAATPASPNFIPVGGEYRLSMTTYADGDATIWQSTEQGKIITGSEQVHDAGVTGWASMIGAEYKLIDGAALPNVVSNEADITRLAASIGGSLFSTLVTQDGLGTPLAVHDDAIANGLGTAAVMGGAEAKDFDGAVLPNVVDAEGDVVRLAASLYGVQYIKLVNETGALGLDNIEDEQHASGDLGIMALAIRNDILASLVGTDGDYAGLQVNDIGALFVTGEHREDDAHVTLDYGHQVLGVRNDILASLCDTDGDYTPPQMNDIGAMFVTGEHREDDAHVTLDYGHAVWTVRNDVLAQLTDTDGDYAPFQTDALGALFSTMAAQADLETTHHTAASVTAAGTVADVDGYTIALINANEDTAGWDRTGTYTVQVSPDGGTTYKNADLYEVESGRALPGAAIPIISDENRSYLVDLRGMDKLRVSLSVTVAGTTGTITITSRAIPISDSILHVMSQGSDGTAVPPALMLVGGSDGTNLEPLHVAIDNATAGATPNVLIVGGSYKATVDTYADNDAAPLLMTDKGILGVEITSGQNLTPIFDANSRRGYVQLTDGTNEPIITTAYAETLALATDHLQVGAGMYGMDADAVTPIMRAVQVAVDNATVSATPNVLIAGGIYKAALDTYADNDASPFHMAVNGELLVAQTTHDKLNLNATVQMADVDVTAAAPLQVQIGDGTNQAAIIAAILSLKSDLSSVAGTVTDVNSGNKSAGSQRVVIATDDINLAAINAVTGVTTDAAVYGDTNATIKAALRGLASSLYAAGNGTGDLPGVMLTGIETALEKIDDWEGAGNYADYVKAAMYIDNGGSPIIALGDASGHLQVDVISSALPSGGATEATLEEIAGGCTMLFDSDGDNTAQVCKAAAGTFFKADIYNSNAADAFVQLFNVAAGSVTVGTTVPNYVIYVPGEGAASIDFGSPPLEFGTAITYACTTTPTGNGDPAVGLTCSFGYK